MLLPHQITELMGIKGVQVRIILLMRRGRLIAALPALEGKGAQKTTGKHTTAARSFPVGAARERRVPPTAGDAETARGLGDLLEGGIVLKAVRGAEASVRKIMKVAEALMAQVQKLGEAGAVLEAVVLRCIVMDAVPPLPAAMGDGVMVRGLGAPVAAMFVLGAPVVPFVVGLMMIMGAGEEAQIFVDETESGGRLHTGAAGAETETVPAAGITDLRLTGSEGPLQGAPWPHRLGGPQERIVEGQPVRCGWVLAMNCCAGSGKRNFVGRK